MNARSLPLVCCVLLLPAAMQADDGPAANVPGLAELAHYVGEWDIRITTPNSGFVSGHVSTKWILGGRFVEQVGTLSNAAGTESIEVRTLITYDINAGKYHSWTFMSTGSAMNRTGVWNAETQSFSYSGNDNGMTIVTSADFSTENTEEWQISVIDQMGAENVVIAGVNTRREE